MKVENQKPPSSMWRMLSNLFKSLRLLRQADAGGDEVPIIRPKIVHVEDSSRGEKIEHGSVIDSGKAIAVGEAVHEVRDVPVGESIHIEKELNIDDKDHEFIKSKKGILHAPSIKEKTYPDHVKGKPL